jgi:hypothetical protein
VAEARLGCPNLIPGSSQSCGRNASTSASSDGIAYGVSPCDEYLSEPYAYVNSGHTQTGEYWNAPFGAARPMHTLDSGTADAVLDHFRQGRAEAHRAV